MLCCSRSTTGTLDELCKGPCVSEPTDLPLEGKERRSVVRQIRKGDCPSKAGTTLGECFLNRRTEAIRSGEGRKSLGASNRVCRLMRWMSEVAVAGARIDNQDSLGSPRVSGPHPAILNAEPDNLLVVAVELRCNSRRDQQYLLARYAQSFQTASRG